MPEASFLGWQQQFSTKETCLADLTKMKWPNGLICPCCAHNQSYAISCRCLYEWTHCKSKHRWWQRHSIASDPHWQALIESISLIAEWADIQVDWYNSCSGEISLSQRYRHVRKLDETVKRCLVCGSNTRTIMGQQWQAHPEVLSLDIPYFWREYP